MQAKMRVLSLLFLSALLTTASAFDELCAQAFCDCAEAAKTVDCKCQIKQDLSLGPGSVPPQTTSLRISGCDAVELSPNTLARCTDLVSIEFSQLKRLSLSPGFHTSLGSGDGDEDDEEYYDEEDEDTLAVVRDLSNVTVSDVGRLEIFTGSFGGFPRSGSASFVRTGIARMPPKSMEVLADTLVLEDSEIGIMERASLYSDAGTLAVRENRIEHLVSGALDASVRSFVFAANVVDRAEDDALSVACLHGRVVDNVFAMKNVIANGSKVPSPFADFGPDPACVPDPESEAYGDEVAYNVVSNPTLNFNGNYFHAFGDALLNFPGADNVPLGKLQIDGNKVKCDCESLKLLAAAVDFSHTALGARLAEEAASRRAVGSGLGARLFRKEFYDSALCVEDDQGQERERSLKGFLRERVRIEGDEVICGRPGSIAPSGLESIVPPEPSSARQNAVDKKEPEARSDSRGKTGQGDDRQGDDENASEENGGARLAASMAYTLCFTAYLKFL